MATQDMLKTLSKAALERAASAEGLAPRNTAKETRAALIAHVGKGTYVLPAARFALTKPELAELRRRRGALRGHACEVTEGAPQPGSNLAPDGENPGEMPGEQEVDEVWDGDKARPSPDVAPDAAGQPAA